MNPQISVDTGGNTDLQPETSETFTAGFTWDIPVGGDGIERMLVEANYYDITDRRRDPGAERTGHAQCLHRTLDPLFCDQVNRVASGTITSIEGVLSNIGGIETDGHSTSTSTSATAESGVGRVPTSS